MPPTSPAHLSRVAPPFAGRYALERELDRGGMATVGRTRFRDLLAKMNLA